jgi:hypothetical protein
LAADAFAADLIQRLGARVVSLKSMLNENAAAEPEGETLGPPLSSRPISTLGEGQEPGVPGHEPRERRVFRKRPGHDLAIAKKAEK